LPNRTESIPRGNFPENPITNSVIQKQVAIRNALLLATNFFFLKILNSLSGQELNCCPPRGPLHDQKVRNFLGWLLLRCPDFLMRGLSMGSLWRVFSTEIKRLWIGCVTLFSRTRFTKGRSIGTATIFLKDIRSQQMFKP